MLEPVLQEIIEDLCNNGCKAVSQYIEQIEAGSIPRQMAHLRKPDQKKILVELKSIMAVYDRCHS
jgi:hypothetical protein